MSQDEVWITKEGEEILVKDMSETHVRNTLRMIIRQRRKQDQYQDEYDGAKDCIFDIW